jgi:uncharacterized protein YqeY
MSGHADVNGFATLGAARTVAGMSPEPPPPSTPTPEPAEAELPLEQRLRRALPPAMKARDTAAVSALRTALAAIANAGAVAAPAPPATGGTIAGAHIGLGAGEAARRELSDDQVAAIVRAEIDERLTAAAEYTDHGQADQAARVTAEAAVLAAHLER